MTKRKVPNYTTNLQWHHYYVARYNKDPTNTDACLLAMYYLFNHLAEQDKTTFLASLNTKPEVYWEHDGS